MKVKCGQNIRKINDKRERVFWEEILKLKVGKTKKLTLRLLES
jgi:hypothetical protein